MTAHDLTSTRSLAICKAAEERQRREAKEAAELAALEAAAAAEADLVRAQRMKDAVAERVAAEKARLKVRATIAPRRWQAVI